MIELFGLSVFVLMVGYICAQIKQREDIRREDCDDSDTD